MQRRRSRFILSVLAMVCLAGSLTPSVGAATLTGLDPVASATRVAGAATAVSSSGSALVRRDARVDASLTLSKEPTAAVVLGSRGSRVTVGVPAKSQARFDRNNAVFAGSASFDIVTRATTTGGQVLATLRSKDAPSAFRFPISVSHGTPLLLPQPDGSVAVVVQEGGAVRQTAVVAAPWAIDATGRHLPTRLEVSGSAIVQHVDHRGARYPVVADPNVTNCGIATCSLYIGRARTAAIAKSLSRYANASAAAIAGAFAVACAPIGGVAAVVCGGAGAVGGGFAIDQFLAARSQGKCIRLRYLAYPSPAVVGVYVDGSGYCKA